MRPPAREAWRRLPWRRWIARGILLGLCAATVLGIAVFVSQRASPGAAHPGLAGGWLVYLGLGIASLAALIALLARRRHGLRALTLISVLVFAFEALQFGWGLHLARVPIALLLAWWADRQLPAMHASEA